MSFAVFLLVCASLLGFSLGAEVEQVRRFVGFSPSKAKPISKSLVAVESLLTCANKAEPCDVSLTDAQTITELYCKALWAVPADKYKQLGLKPIELKLIQLKCNANYDMPTPGVEEKAKQS